MNNKKIYEMDVILDELEASLNIDYQKIYDLKIKDVNIYDIAPKIKNIIALHEQEIASYKYKLGKINDSMKKAKQLFKRLQKLNVNDDVSCSERDMLIKSIKKENKELDKFKEYVYMNFKYIS